MSDGNDQPEPPRPVNSLDEQLQKTVSGLHRLRWYALAVFGLVVCLAIGAGAVMILRQQNQLQSSCEFWGVIGAAPIAAPKPSAPPSLLGVTLILEARSAYIGQGCGRPPPADPSIVRWAHYYHLPVP